MPLSSRSFLALLLGSILPADAQTSVQGRPTMGERVDTGFQSLRQWVRAYEPNQIGATKDEGDDWCMDFTLSLVVPMPAPESGTGLDREGFGLPRLPNWEWYPFAAMTLRASQYLTRPSAPVVGKRFNPLVGARFLRLGRKQSVLGYVDVVYGHESNGQSIAAEDSFRSIEEINFRETNDRALAHRIARDDLSRGWDYAGLKAEALIGRVSLSLTTRVYLSESVPQGEKEEYRGWEEVDEKRPRNHYDGLTVGVTWEPWNYWTASASYTTGIARLGRFSTGRVEFGRLIARTDWRVFAFGRWGYNSDLIDYYHKDSGWGIAMSLFEPRASRYLTDPGRRRLPSSDR